MADYFDSAATANDQRKQALLDAIRSQGSQAKAAFDAGQAAIAQQKQAAVAAALADATKRGAPQGELDQISSTVGSPYDRRTSDLSSAATSRLSSIDAIGASGGKYFDEANAALPALRTQQSEHKASMDKQLAYQLANLKQQAEDRALSRQITLENLRNAQEARAAKAAAAAKPPGTAKLLTDLFGGAQGFVDVADAQNSELVPQYLGDFAGQRGANGPGSAPMSADAAGQMYAESLGQNNGLPAGLGGGLVRTAQQKAAAAALSQGGSSAALRSDKNYADAVNDFLNGASLVGTKQGGKTLTTADVFATLTSHYGAELARQVIADYSKAIPGATTGF